MSDATPSDGTDNPTYMSVEDTTTQNLEKPNPTIDVKSENLVTKDPAETVTFYASTSAEERGTGIVTRSRHSARLSSHPTSGGSPTQHHEKKVVAVKPSMAPVEELGNSYPDWSVLERELELAKTKENAYFLDASFLRALTLMDLWLGPEGAFFMPRREFRHRHAIFSLFWQPSAPNHERSNYLVPPKLSGLLRWYLTRDNFIKYVNVPCPSGQNKGHSCLFFPFPPLPLLFPSFEATTYWSALSWSHGHLDDVTVIGIPSCHIQLEKTSQGTRNGQRTTRTVSVSVSHASRLHWPTHRISAISSHGHLHLLYYPGPTPSIRQSGTAYAAAFRLDQKEAEMVRVALWPWRRARLSNLCNRPNPFGSPFGFETSIWRIQYDERDSLTCHSDFKNLLWFGVFFAPLASDVARRASPQPASSPSLHRLSTTLLLPPVTLRYAFLMSLFSYSSIHASIIAANHSSRRLSSSSPISGAPPNLDLCNFASGPSTPLVSLATPLL